MPFARVLFEPVRSAEPPTISGTTAVSIPRAFSDATRVAISFGALASSCLNLRNASPSPSGRSPLMRRANSLRLSIRRAAGRPSPHQRRAGEPVVPSLMRGLRALTSGAPPVEHIGRDFERRIAPAELLAG